MTNWRRTLAAAVTVTAGVVTAVVGAGPADALTPRVHCGDTITGPVRLHADLHCTAGIGLTLLPGADVDLHGHALVGPGRTEGIGVRVGIPPDSATGAVPRLHDGRVSSWMDGAFLGSDQGGVYAGSASIARVTFANNDAGVNEQLDGDVTYTGVRFVHNTYGLAVNRAYATVRQSIFAGNAVGLTASLPGQVTIDRSAFVRNQSGLRCGGLAAVSVIASGFRANTTGATDGIDCDLSIKGSWVVGNSTGVEGDVLAGRAYLKHDRFLGNGVAVSAGGTVADSVFAYNRTGLTTPEATGAVVQRNLFVRNWDGVNTVNPVSLGSNLALFNRGWGIYAPAATDLGGNRALGNGRSPQCVGVVCSP